MQESPGRLWLNVNLQPGGFDFIVLFGVFCLTQSCLDTSRRPNTVLQVHLLELLTSSSTFHHKSLVKFKFASPWLALDLLILPIIVLWGERR